ncbi:MAG: hypothetical protein K0S32_165 [Bacteroidetes bacterium]|jgi:uncharacterized protein (TIGR02231 family)|nr:hypothetical protein [Bacteroidota bacterium]
MKKILIVAGLLCFGIAVSQNVENVQVKTPVKSVTLYLDGAEVAQAKQVNLNAGRTLITFTGLSPKLISKSIQVNVAPDVTVLSVSDKINFLSESKETPRLKQIKDSIEMLSDANMQLQWQIDAFNGEKAMLAKNESIGGNDKGVNPADLKLALDLYRTRLKEIHTELFALVKKRDKTNLVIAKLNRQMSENGETELPTAEISILVNANAKTSTNVDLRYVVKESGWSPSYDLISEDVNKPIELKYRAKVYNNSGIDWNDVKIKLSTSDPMQSASKPEMQPWFLNFSNPIVYNTNSNPYGNYGNDNRNSDNYQQQQAVSQTKSLYENELSAVTIKGKKDEQKKQNPSIQYEEVQVSELSAEFDIKQAYSIPADAKPYIVDVITYNLNATFQYYSVPKIEKEAFMLARITGWEELDLVEGPANVYLAGTFVGQSYINTRSVDDTLNLSFGRDKKIMVTRTKLKDFNKETTSGTSRKVTYSYEMIVKNNHKGPIQIELADQLPVSQSSEIIVDAIETSKAEVNALTGQMKWKISLAPDESKKIILTYSVKYPKNKSLNLYKSKAKYRAKF